MRRKKKEEGGDPIFRCHTRGGIRVIYFTWLRRNGDSKIRGEKDGSFMDWLPRKKREKKRRLSYEGDNRG